MRVCVCALTYVCIFSGHREITFHARIFGHFFRRCIIFDHIPEAHDASYIEISHRFHLCTTHEHQQHQRRRWTCEMDEKERWQNKHNIIIYIEVAEECLTSVEQCEQHLNRIFDFTLLFHKITYDTFSVV